MSAPTKTFFVRLLWPIQDATYIQVAPSSPGEYVDAWNLNKFTGVMEKSGVRVSPTDELEGCLYDVINARNATVWDLQMDIRLVRWQILNLRDPKNLEFIDFDNLKAEDLEPYRFSSLVVAETRDKILVVCHQAPLVSQYAQAFRETLGLFQTPAAALQRTDDKDALPAVLRVLNTQSSNSPM